MQMLTYKVFEEKRMVSGKEHTNVFGLDKEKVQAVIDALGDKEKSIEEINANEAKAAGIYIVTDTNGEPQMVIIRGGKYGLSEAHFGAMVKALSLISRADSDFVKVASTQRGMKFLSAESSFKQLHSVGSNDGSDTAYWNKDTNADYLVAEIVAIAESYEIEAQRKNEDSSRIVGAVSVAELNYLKTK